MKAVRFFALAVVVAAVIATVGVGLSFVTMSLAFWTGLGYRVIQSRTAIPLFLFFVVGAPLGVCAILGRILWKRLLALYPPPNYSVRVRRVVWAVLGMAYVLTVVFGAPAVQSERNTWAVAEYKRLASRRPTMVWDPHPYIWTYASLPVAPGVILTYHEHQLAGTYGFGGFELSLWYGVGVRSLWTYPLWLS